MSSSVKNCPKNKNLDLQKGQYYISLNFQAPNGELQTPLTETNLSTYFHPRELKKICQDQAGLGFYIPNAIHQRATGLTKSVLGALPKNDSNPSRQEQKVGELSFSSPGDDSYYGDLLEGYRNKDCPEIDLNEVDSSIYAVSSMRFSEDEFALMRLMVKDESDKESKFIRVRGFSKSGESELFKIGFSNRIPGKEYGKLITAFQEYAEQHPLYKNRAKEVIASIEEARKTSLRLKDDVIPISLDVDEFLATTPEKAAQIREEVKAYHQTGSQGEAAVPSSGYIALRLSITSDEADLLGWVMKDKGLFEEGFPPSDKSGLQSYSVNEDTNWDVLINFLVQRQSLCKNSDDPRLQAYLPRFEKLIAEFTRLKKAYPYKSWGDFLVEWVVEKPIDVVMAGLAFAAAGIYLARKWGGHGGGGQGGGGQKEVFIIPVPILIPVPFPIVVPVSTPKNAMSRAGQLRLPKVDPQDVAAVGLLGLATAGAFYTAKKIGPKLIPGVGTVATAYAAYAYFSDSEAAASETKKKVSKIQAGDWTVGADTCVQKFEEDQTGSKLVTVTTDQCGWDGIKAYVEERRSQGDRQAELIEKSMSLLEKGKDWVLKNKETNLSGLAKSAMDLF